MAPVALRKWRSYLCTAAGPLAFPAEGPGDHRRSRLRGQTKAACPVFDTWHLTLSPLTHVEQQSLLSMRRDERRELDRRQYCTCSASAAPATGSRRGSPALRPDAPHPAPCISRSALPSALRGRYVCGCCR